MGVELDHVRAALDELASASLAVWLFGGWGEQLRGLRAPGPHKDIDLLLDADGFGALDALITERGYEEIAAKHLAHKRAWLVDGVMVEAFLVRRDEDGPYTAFAHGPVHRWPQILGSPLDGLPAASAATLASYRAAHARLHAR